MKDYLFLYKGMTLASFSLSGKMPVLNTCFINVVRAIEQLICQHTKASDPKLSPMPKQKRIGLLQSVAPPCACWAAAFFDVVDPRR